MLSSRNAAFIILAISAAAMVYHLLIMTSVIDYTAVWGGRLNSYDEMIVFESVSVLLQSVLIVALLIKQKFIQLPVPIKAVNFILWIYLIVFALNTIGNLAAINVWERVIGTLATLVTTLLLWRILSDTKLKK
jgi:hypothetical protein